MEVKDIIRNRRIELDLTMKDVAEKVGVSEGTISRWESGNISNMRRDKIVLLAKALKIKPDVIMGWEDAPATVHPDGQPVWYLDEEASALALELLSDPEKRALLDSVRKLKPEDVRLANELLRRFKGDSYDE